MSVQGAIRAWAGLALGLAASGCMDFEQLEGPIPLGTHVADWRDQVIYQVLVDRFADGDRANNHNVVLWDMARWHGGDWAGLEGQLGYLENLGVTALWISPVVKNLETDAGFDAYHGYWTQDFAAPNPHFGDLRALRSLVRAAHDRGMLVIVDIVTNHIGQLFYYDINRNGQPDEYFIGGGGQAYGSNNNDFPSSTTRTSEWDPDYDSRGIQAFSSLGESGPAPIEWVHEPAINRLPPEPAEFANPAWYNRRGRVTVWRHEQEACQFLTGLDDPGYWWEVPECRAYMREQETKGDFPGGLKDLDTTRCDVKQALVDVFARWVELTDVDGFRIDTLKHVENEFWRYFCQKIRQRLVAKGKERFFMFGEAFDGHIDLVGSYTTHELPSGPEGEREQQCVTDGRGLTGDQLDGVFHFPQYYRAIRGVFQDGGATSGIADLWAQEAEYIGSEPNQHGIGIAPDQALVNFLDNHDVERFLFNGQATVERLHLALLYLFTRSGIPCIYYGTEQQLAGGNDPANREDLWKSGYDESGPTYRWIQRLSALRKRYAALRRGDAEPRWSSDHAEGESDAGIFAFERSGGGAEGSYALVVLNAHAAQPSSTSFDGGVMQTSLSGGTALVDVLDSAQPSYTVAADGSLELSVLPLSGMVLVPADQVAGQ